MSGALESPGRHVDTEFEAIFFEYYERIFRALSRLVGSDQAGELANEVFLRLSQRPDRWLLTNNVGSWLYRTATRAGIDALRASAHRKRYEHAAALDRAYLQAQDAGPLRDVLREEHRRTVQEVLSSMKPAQAQILLMRADGASYKEIAETLRVVVGGVGTLLNRAEMEFRKRYLKVTGKKENL